MAMAKSVVGLFDGLTEAQAVVQDLVNHGFPRDDISIVAPHTQGEHARSAAAPDDTDETSGAVIGAGTGAVLGGIAGLLVGIGVLAIPGIGPILAAGPIMAALTGAGIGALAGGLIGALTDLGVPEEEARYYAEGVRRGGSW
ncbi:MAG TPA: general stress protein [Candidatus Binatia bacterium]|nr:general stress protein [Candidatus Binatia bacterium]